MKKKFYNVGTLLYLRNHKCGLETAAIIAIGSAVATTAATTYSATSQASAVKDANQKNLELNELALAQQKQLFTEGNIFNMREAEKAREFNSKEAALGRSWQEQMSDKQFQKAMDWFDKYSSPSSQYQQYLAAGLNPASLVGNINGYSPTFSLPSASSATGSAASSANIPQLPVAKVQPENLDIGNIFKSAIESASGAMNVANQGQDYQQKLTDNQYRKLLHEANLVVQKETSNKLRKEIDVMNADITYTNKKIDEIGANIVHLGHINNNMDADTQIKKMELFYKSAQYEQLLKNMEQQFHIDRRIADATIKEIGSRILKNRADSASAWSQAEYYKAVSALQPEYQKQVKAYTALLGQQTGIARTQNFLDTLFGMDEREQKLKIGNEVFEKARFENTTYFRLMQFGRSAGDMVGDAFLTYYGARGLGFIK